MELDQETRRLLERFGFDEALFEQLRRRYRAGALSAAHNRIVGQVEPPAAEDVRRLPPPDSAGRAALTERGLVALRAGQVGCVVLAGGMATRFGGVVKAGVDALPGRSFLSLKLADIASCARRAGARVPAFLMGSFATDDELRRLSRDLATEAMPVEVFPQLISLRLDEAGELFRGADGAPSPYAPGHGDLTFALRLHGVVERFRRGGGKLLYMSNVDNLAATLEPAVIGAHLEGGAAVTAEVVAKDPGDKGGAPARVDGVPQIVEDFRFPEGFDQDRIPVFNVNSFCLDAAAIDRDFPLSWFVVKKSVDGRPAIQFEHLVGELTAFLPSRFLHVERRGPDGRFQPVKDPDELERRRPDIEAIMRARGVL